MEDVVGDVGITTGGGCTESGTFSLVQFFNLLGVPSMSWAFRDVCLEAIDADDAPLHARRGFGALDIVPGRVVRIRDDLPEGELANWSAEKRARLGALGVVTLPPQSTTNNESATCVVLFVDPPYNTCKYERTQLQTVGDDLLDVERRAFVTGVRAATIGRASLETAATVAQPVLPRLLVVRVRRHCAHRPGQTGVIKWDRDCDRHQVFVYDFDSGRYHSRPEAIETYETSDLLAVLPTDGKRVVFYTMHRLSALHADCVRRFPGGVLPWTPAPLPAPLPAPAAKKQRCE